MDDFEVVQDVAKAKEWLTANPTQINGFDAKYGLGSSKAILTDTYDTYEAPTEPEDGWGIDMIKGAVEGNFQTGAETVEFLVDASTVSDTDIPFDPEKLGLDGFDPNKA